MTKEKLAEICGTAADVILRDGFLKGEYGSVEGPKCALGALRYAFNGNPHKQIGARNLPKDQLTRLFKATRPRSTRETVVDFNDASRTRRHDVVKVLRDMAVQALA